MDNKFSLTAALQLQAPSNAVQMANYLRKTFGNITTRINVVTDSRALQDITRDMDRLRVASQKTAGFYSEIGNILANATRRFAGISIATGTFLGLARAVKSGIGDAITFERELAKVAQATETSINSVKRLGKEVGQIAQEFGASSNELVKFGRIFSQAGFNVKETTASLKLLAKTDLIGTFGDMANTAEGIITTLAVFSKEAKGSAAAIGFLERSFDSINRVAKKYAVESEDIITAVRRTGAVFQAAGGNLNELEAVFTSIRATTRESADTIANGLKTIFTRLQRSETLDTLKELGVELEDLNGKFIGPYQAIQKIGLALSALPEGSIRKNSILEEIGGVYQIGRLIPAVKNYALQQQILNESLKSQGDINKDVSISQETLSFKINKTKESFANLIRSLSDSGTFKKLAEGGLAFGNSLIKVVDTLKNLLPYLAAYAAFSSTRIAISFGKSFLGGRIKQPSSSAKALLGDTKIGGLSSGGQVGGRLRNVPGFGTDSELTALTPGEFVVNRKATKKNEALLQAINSGKKVGKFAKGGKIKKPSTPDEHLLDVSDRKAYNEKYRIDESTETVDKGGEYNVDYNPGPNRSNKTVTRGFTPISDEERKATILAKKAKREAEEQINLSRGNRESLRENREDLYGGRDQFYHTELPIEKKSIPFNPSHGDRESLYGNREQFYGDKGESYESTLPTTIGDVRGRTRSNVQSNIAKIQAENERIQQRLEADQHIVDDRNNEDKFSRPEFPRVKGSYRGRARYRPEGASLGVNFQSRSTGSLTSQALKDRRDRALPGITSRPRIIRKSEFNISGFDPSGGPSLQELQPKIGGGRNRPEVQAKIARIQAENEQVQRRLEEDQHKVDDKNYPTVAGSKQFPSFNGSKDLGSGLLGSNESGYIEPPNKSKKMVGETRSLAELRPATLVKTSLEAAYDAAGLKDKSPQSKERSFGKTFDRALGKAYENAGLLKPPPKNGTIYSKQSDAMLAVLDAKPVKRDKNKEVLDALGLNDTSVSSRVQPKFPLNMLPNQEYTSRVYPSNMAPKGYNGRPVASSGGGGIKGPGGFPIGMFPGGSSGPNGPNPPSSSSKSPTGPSGPNDLDEVKSAAGYLTGGFNALSIGLLLGVDSLKLFDDATNSAIKSAAAMGLLIHSAVNSVLPSLILGIPKATALLNKFGIGTSQAAKAVVASQVAETAANVTVTASENVETSANLSSAAKKSGLGVQTAVAGVAIGLGLVSAGFEYYAAKWRTAADKLDIDIDKAFTVLSETGKGDLGKMQKDASSAQKLRNDANTNENIGFGAFGGGLAGAGAGFAIAGPIGLAVGAAVGAAIGGVGGFANSSGVTQNEKNALKYVIDAQYDAAKATQVFTKALEHNKRFVIRPEENFKREGIQIEDYSKKLQNILRETTLAQLEFGKREKDSFGFVKNKTPEQIKNNEKAKDTEKETIQKFKDLNVSRLDGLLNIINERNKTAKSSTDISKNFNNPGVRKEIALMRQRAIDSGDDVKVFDTSIAKLLKEYENEVQKGAATQLAANAAREAELRLLIQVNEAMGKLTQSGLNIDKVKSDIAVDSGQSIGGISNNRFSDLSNVGNLQNFEKDVRTVSGDMGSGGNKIAKETINIANVIQELRKNLTAQQLENISPKNVGKDVSNKKVGELLDNIAPSLSGSSKEFQEIITNKVREALGDSQIHGDELANILSAASSAGKSFGDILNQTNSQMLDTIGILADTYGKALEAKSNVGDLVSGRVGIEQTGRDRLEQARKGNLTNVDLDRAVSERDNTRKKISGINLRAAGVTGDVGGTAVSAKRRLASVRSALENNGLSKEVRKQLAIEEKNLTNIVRVATDELKKLANQADKASDILGQIDREQASKDFVKGKAESFVTGGFEDRFSIFEQFAGLQNVMNTGTFQNLPEDLRKSVSGLVDELARFDPNGTAVKAKNNAIANDIQRFNASRGQKTDPKFLDLIRGGTTNKEDKLIADLARLNAEEKKAQDALIKVEVENTSVMTKLIGKIDQMLGGKGNVPIVPNVQVPRNVPPVNVPVAQPLTIKEQRAKAQQEAKDRYESKHPPRSRGKASYFSNYGNPDASAQVSEKIRAKDAANLEKANKNKEKIEGLRSPTEDRSVMGGMMNVQDMMNDLPDMISDVPFTNKTEPQEQIKNSSAYKSKINTDAYHINHPAFPIPDANANDDNGGKYKYPVYPKTGHDIDPATGLATIPRAPTPKTPFDPVTARKALDEDMARKAAAPINQKLADKKYGEDLSKRGAQIRAKQEAEKRKKEEENRKRKEELDTIYYTSTNFARGGPIYAARGVDRVPIMAQAGEAIINKSSVNKIGRNNIQSLNNGTISGGSGVNVAALSSFTNNLKTTLESVIKVIPTSINSLNTSLQTVTSSLNGIAQSLKNITMKHEINVDGQLNIAGINNEQIVEAIRDSLGEFVANKVIETLSKQNKAFRAS